MRNGLCMDMGKDFECNLIDMARIHPPTHG
jgi:hypothetical protein